MRVKNTKIVKDILLMLAAAGLLAVPVAGPLVFMAIAEELQLENKYNKRKVSQTLGYLKRQGMVGIGYEGDEVVVTLTKKGEEKVLRYNLDNLELKKPLRWDKQWRLVIFDIPEKFRLARDHFRLKLKELGFHQLQKSAWVHPYPCEDVITFLKEVYEIRPFVTLVTAREIDIAKKLRRIFSLF
ncbi:MAG: hypothetical protein HYW51_02520 [Candidatus Doudnabacteria bacterium]|nr:hypothetical protein [Candidatus Doudnabacteria bacterium]